MGNATEAEVREALGTGLPKHPLHKIVCIGALVASRQPEGLARRCAGSTPHRGAIRGSVDPRLHRKNRPAATTADYFNGHSFDLPVLRYRAMVNRVPALGLQVQPVLSPVHRRMRSTFVGATIARSEYQRRRRHGTAWLVVPTGGGHLLSALYWKEPSQSQCAGAYTARR